jgi:hypothetical protein
MAIALLTLFIGAVGLWAAFYVFYKVRQGRGWPTVPGDIIERRVGPEMGVMARGSYAPYVKYNYSVEGKEYSNTQFYLVGRIGNSRKAIQRLVDSLPNPVPVHYNPQDAAQSYLLVNPTWTGWLLLVVGAVVSLCGLLQLFVELMRPLLDE